MASLNRVQARHQTDTPAGKPVRRLPVQKDWPTWALVAAQIGILVGALSLWEIGARTGWMPRHVVVEDGGGALLAAAPMYVKGHSNGEYVFDHSWADALERAAELDAEYGRNPDLAKLPMSWSRVPICWP